MLSVDTVTSADTVTSVDTVTLVDTVTSLDIVDNPPAAVDAVPVLGQVWLAMNSVVDSHCTLVDI